MNSSKKIGTVLIVDDEELDQKIYRRILMRSGLVDDVIGFTYPDRALEFLAASDRPVIDVLFLDINMPIMDGFEFLKSATERFGKDFAKTVVVLLTTSLDAKDQERAKQFEVVKAYINKPLVPEHIEKILNLID